MIPDPVIAHEVAHVRRRAGRHIPVAPFLPPPLDDAELAARREELARAGERMLRSLAKATMP